MLGLLLWYRETGKEQYLEAIKRAADLFIHLFYNPETGSKPLSAIGSTEMNLAPIHIFALLYEETGDSLYLNFVNQIANDFGSAGSGDYINSSLNGLEFFQCPKPRWESLHCIIGIAELYRANGNALYLRVAEQIFRSILKTDVHNTGGFSTREQAIGNPFTNDAIETCCVIAYNALGVEILKLTGDSTIVDHLELSHYNACMGSWSPSGRWSTYDTPMNGVRLANTTSIQFQSRPGSPELNCCSVNAARSVSMIGEWAVMKHDRFLYLNAYEAADYETEDGTHISLSGGYPYQNRVTLTVNGGNGELYLRIPGWSSRTVITVGDHKHYPTSGSYYLLPYEDGLPIILDFDFTTRFTEGDLDMNGLTSVNRGPILYGTDTSLCGKSGLDRYPALSRKEIIETPVTIKGDSGLIILPCGITLCDFYHLGVTGAEYASWLRLSEST